MLPDTIVESYQTRPGNRPMTRQRLDKLLRRLRENLAPRLYQRLEDEGRPIGVKISREWRREQAKSDPLEFWNLKVTAYLFEVESNGT